MTEKAQFNIMDERAYKAASAILESIADEKIYKNKEYTVNDLFNIFISQHEWTSKEVDDVVRLVLLVSGAVAYELSKEVNK